MIKKIDKFNRITIPIEFQRKLGLKKGDIINIEFEDNKIIILSTENELKKRIQKEIKKYTQLLNKATKENKIDEINAYMGYVMALDWVLRQEKEI